MSLIANSLTLAAALSSIDYWQLTIELAMLPLTRRLPSLQLKLCRRKRSSALSWARWWRDFTLALLNQRQESKEFTNGSQSSRSEIYFWPIRIFMSHALYLAGSELVTTATVDELSDEVVMTSTYARPFIIRHRLYVIVWLLDASAGKMGADHILNSPYFSNSNPLRNRTPVEINQDVTRRLVTL